MHNPQTYYSVFQRTENGYNEPYYSDGFPKTYRSHIQEVTHNFAEYCNAHDRMLQYEPLEGNHFLLSVFIPGTDGKRGTIELVHFLMNATAVCSFFYKPFTLAASAAYKLAEDILSGQPLDWKEFYDSAPGTEYIYDPNLIYAAAYDKTIRLSCGDYPPDEYLEKCLAFLPFHLRYRFPFRIDGDSVWVNGSISNNQPDLLDGPHLPALDRIPDEVPLYHHLHFCIYDWDTFLTLGNRVMGQRISLKSVLKLLGEERVAGYLETKGLKLNRDDLQKLYDATKPKFLFIKSPIYKVLCTHHLKPRQPVQKRSAPVNRSRKTDLSFPLFLLLTAVCFMSTVLLLSGADPKWSLLSLPPGIAAGVYLTKLWKKGKRR